MKVLFLFECVVNYKYYNIIWLLTKGPYNNYFFQNFWNKIYHIWGSPHFVVLISNTSNCRHVQYFGLDLSSYLATPFFNRQFCLFRSLLIIERVVVVAFSFSWCRTRGISRTVVYLSFNCGIHTLKSLILGCFGIHFVQATLLLWRGCLDFSRFKPLCDGHFEMI